MDDNGYPPEPDEPEPDEPESYNLARALKAAGFDASAASPLQHDGPCDFWREGKCTCPILRIADALTAVPPPELADDGARWGMIRAALTTPDLLDAETRLLAIAAVLHSRDPYTADDIRRTHELFPHRRVAVETPHEPEEQ